MPFQSMTVQEFFNSSCVYTTSLPTSSIVAANDDPLSMSDVRRIFYGKRVVFAGDPSIRSIYRDMGTFIVTGHRLSSSEVAVQNGKKLTPRINERQVRAGGRIGMSDYIDERICQWSPSSSLHHIHLPSLHCQESNELLRLVRGADLLILSSVKGDMSWTMIQTSPVPFSQQLDAYASKVFSLCRRIVEVTTSVSTGDGADPVLLWLTPLPLSKTLSQKQKNEFLQIVSAGENSAKMAGFQLFDRLNISLADGGAFASNKSGHFSSVGIRLVTTLLAEVAAKHWQRPFRPPVSLPLSPLPLVIDITSDVNSIIDDNSSQE